MELFRYFKKQQGWGIEVKNCGYQHTTAGEPYPPPGHPETHAFSWEKGRKLNEFQIVYIPSGSGIFESEKTAMRTIQSGDLILLYEGEWHRYKPNEQTGWDTYWTGFDGKYFREHILHDLYPQRRCTVKPIGYQDHVVMAMEQIIQMSKRNIPNLGKMLSGSLMNLLGILIGMDDQQTPEKKKDDIIEQSIFMLRQHIQKPIDFEKMALQFNMSYSGFRKLFKSKTGLALNQFLIREKLQLAQRMLRNTSLPLNEIADKCGFESLHYFSRLYKLKNGYSPSEERR